VADVAAADVAHALPAENAETVVVVVGAAGVRDAAAAADDAAASAVVAPRPRWGRNVRTTVQSCQGDLRSPRTGCSLAARKSART